MAYSASFDPIYNGLLVDYLPGNIINANMRGYTTRFDNNTPAYIAAQSTAMFYQNKPAVPDIIEVIPGETGKSDNTQTQADKDFQTLLDFYMNATPEEIQKAGEALMKADAAPDAQICQSLSDENYFGIPFKTYCNVSVEGLKRGGLAIVGILLLVIGIRYFAKG